MASKYTLWEMFDVGLVTWIIYTLHRPVHTWFPKFFSVQMSVCVHVCVCVCVFSPLRLLITSDTMWHDMNLIRLVKQVLQLL